MYGLYREHGDVQTHLSLSAPQDEYALTLLVVGLAEAELALGNGAYFGLQLLDLVLRAKQGGVSVLRSVR